MPENSLEVAVMMADISGSSALYDDIGDADALRQVGACLDNLRAIVEREGGTFIRSKGDDVLSIFVDTGAALAAARAMFSQPMTGPALGLHVGASFGNVIRARDDIFGDSVNTAARLTAMAKPGELLVSDRFVDRLPASDRQQLRLLDTITFKGKDAPTRIYTLVEEDAMMRTVVGDSPQTTDAHRQEHAAPAVTVKLHYASQVINCPARSPLSIGRSSDNDIVIAQPWISREHARLRVRRGKVELTDQSSSGTYVSVQPGYEFLVKRETVLLSGSGSISPGMPPTAPEAEVIRFEVNLLEPDRATPG